MPQCYSPIRVFVQARMSSSRFPGKVLAPIQNKPMIMHLLERLHRVISIEDVVVLTSENQSDDPLFAYISSLQMPVFRGDLLNPFQRFRNALIEYPCEWFFRICGDSPLFDEQLIPMMLKQSESIHADIHTNLFPRTFPKGQSLELIRKDIFMDVDVLQLTEQECEHVTPFFYTNAEKYSIVNMENPNQSDENKNVVVDTLDELKALENNWDAINNTKS